MYNIVLDITAALYTGSVYHVLYLYSAYYNTSPYEGYIVSVIWKIVLLTLAASRGVIDLYPS